MEHHVSSEIGLPREPRLHPITRLRLDRHRELHPGHRQRYVTGVADREASVACECGAVFESTPGDEATYREIVELQAKANEQRHLARKCIATAVELEAEAYRLANDAGEG